MRVIRVPMFGIGVSERRDAPAIQRIRRDVAVQQGDAAHAGFLFRTLRVIAQILFWLFFRLRVSGLKNLPKGPVILCINHLGWADPVLPLLLFPAEPRIYIVGEREVACSSTFYNRSINKLAIMVSLDRDKPREALDAMQDVLNRGGSLIIFPEGQLGKEEGRLGELKHGAALLSIRSGRPLVPVGLTGTRELWLRRRLTMRVGTAIHPPRQEAYERTNVRTTTAALEASMHGLLPGDDEQARVKLLGRWLTNLL